MCLHLLLSLNFSSAPIDIGSGERLYMLSKNILSLLRPCKKFEFPFPVIIAFEG